MRLMKYILAAVLMTVTLLCRAEETAPQEGSVDVSHMLFGHIGDSYGWHITDWNGKHVTIPLPCIVYSTTGWHFFMSSHIEHGYSYKGLFIAEEGRYKDKIVEMNADGEQIRPFDISITKNVASLMFTAILLIFLVLSAKRWYSKNDARDKAPGGLAGLVEMMVMMVHDDIIRPSIGEKHYKKFAPYLLTCFFFIFITNLLGLIPLFPGGANLTGNITITFFLAFCTLLAINLFGNKEYWKEIFWPPVPVFLKCPIPIMPLVELLGIISRPFSLMVRLFANIMGGHAAILSFTCVIFITFTIGIGIGSALTPVSLILMIFMNCLECLVAFIQAYVFTMLSAVFIGMAHPEPHHHK